MTLSKLVTWWLPTGSFELNPVAKDHLTIDPVDDVLRDEHLLTFDFPVRMITVAHFRNRVEMVANAHQVQSTHCSVMSASPSATKEQNDP